MLSLTSSVSSAGIVMSASLTTFIPSCSPKRLEDLVFLDHAHAHGHLAQQIRARALLLLEHLPEGFLVEVTHVDHDRAEFSRHVTSSPSRQPGLAEAIGTRVVKIKIECCVEIELRARPSLEPCPSREPRSACPRSARPLLVSTRGWRQAEHCSLAAPLSLFFLLALSRLVKDSLLGVFDAFPQVVRLAGT